MYAWSKLREPQNPDFSVLEIGWKSCIFFGPNTWSPKPLWDPERELCGPIAAFVKTFVSSVVLHVMIILSSYSFVNRPLLKIILSSRKCQELCLNTLQLWANCLAWSPKNPFWMCLKLSRIWPVRATTRPPYRQVFRLSERPDKTQSQFESSRYVATSLGLN